MPTPSSNDLRGFLLGTLAPADAERVAAWVEANPAAGVALKSLPAHDTLTCDLAATTLVEVAAPKPEVERIIEAVTQSLAMAQPQTAAPLTRLGKFRIVREVGQGGMGTVYEAIDERLGRSVALKVVRSKWAEDTTIRQRFLREGRAAAALKSDHLVTIHEADELDGMPFLAMEFLEGVTLEDWLKARPGSITEADLLWVARHVLTGLADIQKSGLIHRDIKPANIWVEPRSERIKLLDFGLARMLEHGESITQPGAFLGTPAYVAPEQADGAVDLRSDLFSLGAVLHRMVSGQSPFQRNTLPATLVAIATAEAPPLAGISVELNRFIARLLAKDPAGRPANAAAALIELQAIEQRLTAKPPVELAFPPRPRRRLLIASGLLAALTLLLAGVIIIIWDKNGKQAVRIELDDRVAQGGKLEVSNNSSGSKTIVPLGPSQGPQLKPTTPTGETRPRPIQVGSRVVVTTETIGFVDRACTVDRPGDVIRKGTLGKVIDYNEDKGHWCVQLDGAVQEKVWLMRSVLAALPD